MELTDYLEVNSVDSRDEFTYSQKPDFTFITLCFDIRDYPNAILVCSLSDL